MDLDRKDHPPYTTPFIHSILSMMVWEIALLAVLGTAQALYQEDDGSFPARR